MGRGSPTFGAKTPPVSVEAVVLREERWCEREVVLGRAPLIYADGWRVDVVMESKLEVSSRS